MSHDINVNRWTSFPRSGPSRLRFGMLLVVASAIGFAAKGILAKLAYQLGLNASTVLSLRMISVLPIYCAGLFFFGRSLPESRPGPTNLDFWKVVVLGLLGFDISALLDFEGLEYIGAGLERLVLFLYPTFVVLLSALLARRRIALREILATLLAYAGLATMTFAGGKIAPDARVGILLVLGSGVFYAVYLVGVEQVLRRVNPLYLTSLVMVVATGAILLQALVSGRFRLDHFDGKALLILLAMGIFSTALPTFFMTVGISMIGANRAALVSFMGPVVTLIMAALFLGETMSVKEGLGGLLVFLGVGFVAFRGRGE